MTQLKRKSSQAVRHGHAPRRLIHGIESLEPRSLLAGLTPCEPNAETAPRTAEEEKVEFATHLAAAPACEAAGKTNQEIRFLLLPQLSDDRSPTWQIPVATSQPQFQPATGIPEYDSWRPLEPIGWGANHATHSIVPQRFTPPANVVIQQLNQAPSAPTEIVTQRHTPESAVSIIDDAIRSLQADQSEWPAEPHAIALAVDIDGDNLSEIGILHAGTWVFDSNHDGAFDAQDLIFQLAKESVDSSVTTQESGNDSSCVVRESGTPMSLSVHEQVLLSVIANLDADSLAALNRGEGVPIFPASMSVDHLVLQGAEQVSPLFPEKISSPEATTETSSNVPEEAISQQKVAESTSSTTR